MRNAYTIFIGNLRGKDNLEDFGADNITRELEGNWMEDCGLDSCGSGQVPALDSFQRDNEPFVSTKGKEFLPR
jgi:hypothetical protein